MDHIKYRVWNVDISLHTGLTSISDLICKWRSSVFCYMASLSALTDIPVPTGSAVPVVRTGGG